MVDVDGYLRRLGVEHAGPPTVDGLHAIHRAHVERIAYTTVDIHLGRRSTVDPAESAHRVVTTGRAGYCLHLNGALSALLAALGYDVRWHVGGVQRRADPEPVGANANHLALTVHGLPSPQCPDGVWFVDAGLGDALYEPLPLRPGVHVQGPFRYRLAPSTVVPDGWRFDHDPAGGSAGMDFASEPASPDAFTATHRWMSTHPQSPFVQVLSAGRRDATGIDVLRGLTFYRVDATGRRDRQLAGSEELFDVLGTVFRMPLSDVDSTGRAELWRSVQEGHQAWLTGER